MSSHEPVSIRINGKRQLAKRDRLKARSELAASLDEAAIRYDEQSEKPHEVNVYERTYETKPARKRYSHFKPFLIAAASATVVGILFGFVMLNIISDLDQSQVSEPVSLSAPVTNVSEGTDDISSMSEENQREQTVSLSSFTFPSLAAYVVQVGIFSTEEQAKVIKTNLKEQGFSAFIWEKGGKYYTFAGLSSTEKGAEQTAQLLKTSGVETYVKEWKVAGMQKETTSSEEEWIKNGVHLFQEHVTTVQDQKELSDYQQWLKSRPDRLSKNGKDFYGTVKLLFTESNQSRIETMFTFWKAYEQYLNG